MNTHLKHFQVLLLIFLVACHTKTEATSTPTPEESVNTDRKTSYLNAPKPFQVWVDARAGSGWGNQ